jgi:DNA polymerase elongation subunit (family B)
MDAKMDRQQLKLLTGPCGKFAHIADPIERIMEEARERARLRVELKLAKAGETREFQTVPQPDETFTMFLARSQQLQALVEPAQRRAKAEKKEASKQATKARHAKGYQGAIQLEPEKGLHIEDPWTNAACTWAKAQMEQCTQADKLVHAAWWQMTFDLLSGKESAATALNQKHQSSPLECVANVNDLHDDLRLPAPVLTLDHAAMYPHIIIQFNLSYETLLTDEDIKKHGYTPRKWTSPVWDPVKKQFVRPPMTGDYWEIPGAGGVIHKFLARPEDTPRGIQGLLPRLLIRLLEERKKAKKELAKWTHIAKVLKWKLKLLDKLDTWRDASKWAIFRQEASSTKGAEAQLQAMDEFEKEVLVLLQPQTLDGAKLQQLKDEWTKKLREAEIQVIIFDKKQGAFKIISNSIYGFTGVPEAIATLPCYPIAESVTYWGRLFIEEDKTMFEILFDGSDPLERPLGRVIYGDTDSIMGRMQFILDRRIRYYRLRLALKEAERRAATIEVGHLGKWLRVVILQAVGPGETSRLVERFLLGTPETISNREQLRTEIQRLLGRWRKQLDEEMFVHASDCGFRSVKAFNNAHILPTKLEFEKIYFPFILFMRKKYAGMKYPAGNTLAEGKREDKGIASVRRDFCDLVNEVMSAGMDLIFIQRNVEAAVHWFRERAAELLSYKTEMHLVTLSKKLNSEYKNPKGFPHLTVVEKMKRRMPGSEPTVGSRVAYYIREPPSGCWAGAPVKLKSRSKTARKWKTSELGEDIMHGIEHGIPYNSEYYLSKQLSNPIAQFMLFIWYPELVPEGDTRSDTYKKAMAKLIKQVGHELFGTLPRPVRNYVCPEEQNSGIRRFAQPLRRCLGCPSTLEPHVRGVVCPQCRPQTVELAAKHIRQVTESHEYQTNCWLECQRCPATGGSMEKARLCENAGCPNYARKRVAAANHRKAVLVVRQLHEELLRDPEPDEKEHVKVQAPAVKRARLDIQVERNSSCHSVASEVPVVSISTVVARPVKRLKLRQSVLSF